MALSLENIPRRRTDTRDVDGYTRIKDVYVPMRDGIELCVDIFLPFSASKGSGKVPVICSLGPYGKDIHSSVFGLPRTDIYSNMMKAIKPLGPDACFELLDPLLFTKDFGYALVRADTRGSGGSYGRLDPFGLERSLQIQADAEGQDAHDLVEWAASQPWSTGKVALAGISYYGMVCYWGAMQKPKHLEALLCYEALCDIFPMSVRKGGIPNWSFQKHWLNNIVLPNQRGHNEGVDKAHLEANRADLISIMEEHEFSDQGVWALFEKIRNLSDIEVPIYSAGNWADAELHLPGNIVAFHGASSEHKWLEMHTGNHLSAFYEPEHVSYQRKFLDYFLMDKQDNGMLDVPRVRLLLKRGSENFYRHEQSFPPPDAEDVTLHLTSDRNLIFTEPPEKLEKIEYEGLSGRVEFETMPFSETFEILGCPYLQLSVLTDAADMDMFITLRAKDPQGKLVYFRGNHDEPMNNFCRGYFRLSYREPDEKLKEQVIPYLSSNRPAKVERGKVYDVMIPLPPTTYIFDAGFTLSLEIGARDTEETIPAMMHIGGDRTMERFGGRNVIFSGGRLILPRVRR